MATRGKKYQEALSLVERGRAYSPQEAVELAKQASRRAFDETVELHLRTTADTKQAEQMVRGVAVLPNGLGRKIRVLVFSQGDAARVAEQAGADYVGGDDLVQKIESGWLEFDVAIATPDMMGRIGKLGRILGRKGLMPNPRTGTVIQPGEIARAVEDARKGRVEYRMDRTAIIHAPVGKASFESRALLENLATLVESVMRQRPAGVKGQFVRSAYLTTTMGPSIKLDLPTTLSLTVE
ncbi:MAG: 50S ribosomal protein L1 [Chloroflexi bacterium]|nr:50S ribosomal protein L1 [Chloroflexota bacterium]